MNNFTPRAQHALALARKEAAALNSPHIGTEHVLLGIIWLGQGVAVNALLKLEINLKTLRENIIARVGQGSGSGTGEIPYVPEVKKALALASEEAKRMKHSYVGTEHLLLGLILEKSSLAAVVLKKFRVLLGLTRKKVLEELDPNLQAETSDPKAEKPPVIHVKASHKQHARIKKEADRRKWSVSDTVKTITVIERVLGCGFWDALTAMEGVPVSAS